jgi:hypothetical protein
MPLIYQTNTLRILVLVEACNKSSKLSCRVLLPEPVIGANAELWVQKGVTLMGAQRGFVIKGESARDHSGYSVSNAGDVNGELLTVFLVTKPLKPVTMTSSPLLPNTLRILVLVEACNKSGFVINGKSVRNYSGRSVSSAGDVNGDGLDDLIIGAYSTNPNDKSNAGESYVVFATMITR